MDDVPQLCSSLFSLAKAMESGWTLGSKMNSIFMTKGKENIEFDKKLESTVGRVYGIEIHPQKKRIDAMGMMSMKEKYGI